MARKPDQKAVVDSLVDEELDLRKLVEQINAKGTQAGNVVVNAVEKLLGSKEHHITKPMLRRIWREVFLGSFLAFVHKGQVQTDQNLKQQITAIRKFGKPITEIEAVVDEDVKQRLSEKEGV